MGGSVDEGGGRPGLEGAEGEAVKVRGGRGGSLDQVCGVVVVVAVFEGTGVVFNEFEVAEFGVFGEGGDEI